MPGRCAPGDPARRLRRMAGLLALLGAGFVAVPASACGRLDDCVVPAGSYRVSPPPGWDGHAPLPLAMFFHGYQQSGDDVMRNQPLVDAFAATGALLVVPNGLGKTWTYPGSPSQARDDARFALSVLDDVQARFPVDRHLVWASGFSQGGSMAWWLACAAGGRFAGFVPFSGAFWEPMPTRCPAGPANLMHVHGLADGTVPMAGRAIGPYRQGDVMQGWALWRGVDACPRAEPDITETVGALTCRSWTGCGSGRVLRLCLHGGGHMLDPAWIAPAWAFVRAVATRGSAGQASAP